MSLPVGYFLTFAIEMEIDVRAREGVWHLSFREVSSTSRPRGTSGIFILSFREVSSTSRPRGTSGIFYKDFGEKIKAAGH